MELKQSKTDGTSGDWEISHPVFRNSNSWNWVIIREVGIGSAVRNSETYQTRPASKDTNSTALETDNILTLIVISGFSNNHFIFIFWTLKNLAPLKAQFHFVFLVFNNYNNARNTLTIMLIKLVYSSAGKGLASS